MVTEAQAKDTYNQARACYKGGAKASCKAFVATGSFSSDKIEIDKGQILTQSQQERNVQTLQNIKDMRDSPAACRRARSLPAKLG
jgi:hypothetical protein